MKNHITKHWHFYTFALLCLAAILLFPRCATIEKKFDEKVEELEEKYKKGKKKLEKKIEGL